MDQVKINQLLDNLYAAASLADQLKIRIPEIYDIIAVVEEEQQ